MQSYIINNVVKGIVFLDKGHYLLERGVYFGKISYVGDFIETWTSFTEKRVKFMKLSTKQLLWGICPRSPRSPPSQPKWCQQVLLRPSLPHAPGVRMTGVQQTPIICRPAARPPTSENVESLLTPFLDVVKFHQFCGPRGPILFWICLRKFV